MSNITQYRAAIMLSTCLISLLLATCFVAAPEVGSAYNMATKPLGDKLPMLTKAYSLPMLRVEPGDPHERPVTKLWALVLWALFLAGPAIIAAWSLCGQNGEQAVTRWVMGLSLFLPVLMFAAVIAVVGLVLPFTCM
jgi:hypothetical protein